MIWRKKIMSKIALALKYRPKTFEDVTEQNAVKATLMNQ
jgi:DNA polymerase III gamma/tau subunit